MTETCPWLTGYPETYGTVVTRPVNWQGGPMTADDCQIQSREDAYKRYTNIWENRIETAAYRNGKLLWRKPRAGD